MTVKRIKMTCDADLVSWVIENYHQIENYDVFDNCDNMTMFRMVDGNKVLILT